MRAAARAAAFGVVVAMATSACGIGAGESSGLGGTVSGDGSSTVFPITEAVAEEFIRENRDVNVTVGVSGTGGGFKKFCNGETDLQNASREIKDSEKEACAAEGVDFVELIVANDGLAVTVNPKNDWITCLTTEELKRIWEPGSKIRNWRDVRPGFPDEELSLFGPGTDSGTFDYFTKVINGEEGASRTDYTASEDDNVLVQGVAGSTGALGYFGFAYFTENQERLKVVGVDPGDGCNEPSDATVKDGSYRPLSRPLFLYVKRSSLARPELRAFMTFFLDNVNALLTDVGYTPLADEVLREQQLKFEQALQGIAAP